MDATGSVSQPTSRDDEQTEDATEPCEEAASTEKTELMDEEMEDGVDAMYVLLRFSRLTLIELGVDGDRVESILERVFWSDQNEESA